jgi:hypothetical protein
MTFQSPCGTVFTCEVPSLDEDVPPFRIFCFEDCYHPTHCYFSLLCQLSRDTCGKECGMYGTCVVGMHEKN